MEPKPFSDIERLLNQDPANAENGRYFTVESKNGLPVIHIHPTLPPIDLQIIDNELKENGY